MLCLEHYHSGHESSHNYQICLNIQFSGKQKNNGALRIGRRLSTPIKKTKIALSNFIHNSFQGDVFAASPALLRGNLKQKNNTQYLFWNIFGDRGRFVVEIRREIELFATRLVKRFPYRNVPIQSEKLEEKLMLAHDEFSSLSEKWAE